MKPPASRPSSMVVTWRELTSPLPVPPLMVCRSEQGDLARLSQGEGAIGAQQHHALGGESADGGEMVGLMSFHTHLLHDVLRQGGVFTGLADVGICAVHSTFGGCCE